MNIFFTASYFGKTQYQYAYDAVLHALEKTNATIISPEKGNYMELIATTDPVRQEAPKRVHYEAIRRGISWADAVVFEISDENFQIGHEMTLAIQAKKHVLCLSLHENFERKIFSKYFHAARYEVNNVQEVIDSFLKTCQKELLPNRFNFFLSNSQLQFLEQQAKVNNISISEYLRELIDERKSA
jgi:hypothetical protein